MASLKKILSSRAQARDLTYGLMIIQTGLVMLADVRDPSLRSG